MSEALQHVNRVRGRRLDDASHGADSLLTFACSGFQPPSVRSRAEVGGLMTYGPNVTATLLRAASYVDRIIKGANPAELAIEQPTKFELVINLKTRGRSASQSHRPSSPAPTR